jgi:hypothetical protein
VPHLHAHKDIAILLRRFRDDLDLA